MEYKDPKALIVDLDALLRQAENDPKLREAYSTILHFFLAFIRGKDNGDRVSFNYGGLNFGNNILDNCLNIVFQVSAKNAGNIIHRITQMHKRRIVFTAHTSDIQFDCITGFHEFNGELQFKQLLPNKIADDDAVFVAGLIEAIGQLFLQGDGHSFKQTANAFWHEHKRAVQELETLKYPNDKVFTDSELYMIEVQSPFIDLLEKILNPAR